MMDSGSAQAVAGFLQAAAGFATLVAAVYGFKYVKKQLLGVERTIQSNTNAHLADQSYRIIEFLADKPQVYDYLYKGKVLRSDDENAVLVLLAVEMVANYLENLTLQHPNMLEQMREPWRAFALDTCKNSPALLVFLDKNRGWYAPELIKLADSVRPDNKVAAGSKDD